jgi:hypothetical protein
MHICTVVKWAELLYGITFSKKKTDILCIQYFLKFCGCETTFISVPLPATSLPGCFFCSNVQIELYRRQEEASCPIIEYFKSYSMLREGICVWGLSLVQAGSVFMGNEKKTITPPPHPYKPVWSPLPPTPL